jgi:hypothetical protein
MAVQLSLAFFALQNLGRPRLQTTLSARLAAAIGANAAQALRQPSGAWSASFVEETRTCASFSAILLIVGSGSFTANPGFEALSPEQFTCF